MTQQSLSNHVNEPGRAERVLELLSAELRSGADVMRSVAFMSVEDMGLRLELVRNRRLDARIDARLFSGSGWTLPDHLADFPAAGTLIALLQLGHARFLRGLGFAWNGNRVARLLLSEGKELSQRMSREDLRRVLALRGLGSIAADGPLPEDAAIDLDGELCLWSWMADLPDSISPLALVMLLKESASYSLFRDMTDAEKARRLACADAWLQATLFNNQTEH